jgi:Fe-S cluster assembly scaffold protein SufB
VTPGEEVLSFDPAAGGLCWRRVTAKRQSGSQAVREVAVGERRLLVTDNHPFLSYLYDGERPRKLGRYEVAYVRADHLTEALVPVTSLDFGEPHKLVQPGTTTTFTGGNQWGRGFSSTRSRDRRLHAPEVTTPELMWLFGLFVGDGSIEVETAANGDLRWGRLILSTPPADRARIRLEEIVATLLPGATPSDRADGRAIAWNSVELVRFFLDNGLYGRATTKRVPEWVFSLPEDQRCAFIAGYLDADGFAATGRRGLSLKSVNRDLLLDVARLGVSLGLTPRLTTEQAEERQVEVVGRMVSSRGAHRLDLPVDARLLAWASDGLRDAAARQTPALLRHHRQIGRSSIELPAALEVHRVRVSDPVGVVPTWDIEVEGTGNFVAHGFIVHNSKLTMKYPSVFLVGPKATGEVLSVAYAGPGQHQDAGAKMIHAAPETTSKIVSKSISKDGGITTYRGLVRVDEGAHGCKSHVQCDALILDEDSESRTLPYMEVAERDAEIGHEATVSKIADEQLFYLMSRGLSQEQAMGMIVNGFIEPVTRTLPMEYAVEWSRLIELQMEGSVG